jgi:hypothetical protein
MRFRVINLFFFLFCLSLFGAAESQPPTGIDSLEQKANEKLAEGDTEAYYSIRRKLAREYWRSDNLKKGLEILDTDIQEMEINQTTRTIPYVKALRNKAGILYNDGEWEEVFNLLYAIDTLAPDTEDGTVERWKALMAAGNYAYRSGDHFTALECYTRRLPLTLQIYSEDSLELGKNYYHLGSTYWWLEEKDSCKLYYNKA